MTGLTIRKLVTGKEYHVTEFIVLCWLLLFSLELEIIIIRNNALSHGPTPTQEPEGKSTVPLVHDHFMQKVIMNKRYYLVWLIRIM